MALHLNSLSAGSSSKNHDRPHLLSLPSETLEAIFKYVRNRIFCSVFFERLWRGS